MINLSILISSSEVSGPGGLFDFDGTLPLVALQFLFLTFLLNSMLYHPLLTAMEERQDYIVTNLSQASERLNKADQLIQDYEQKLTRIRQEAQAEITHSQKLHQEMLEVEVTISQKYIDNLLDTIQQDLLSKKEMILTSLEEIVQSLSGTIETKLSI